MAINIEVSNIQATQLPKFGHFRPRYIVTCGIEGDGEHCTKPTRAKRHKKKDVVWKKGVSFTTKGTTEPSTQLVLRVIIKGTIVTVGGRGEEVGTVTESLENLLRASSSGYLTRKLQKDGRSLGASLSFRIASPDIWALIGRATEDVSNIRPISSRLEAFLRDLEILTSTVETVFSLNSYVKAAFGIVTIGQKIILAQIERDANICQLLDTITEILSFVKEAEPLKRIESQTRILEKIIMQTSECARFIIEYGEKRQSWIKTVAYVIGSQPDEVIRQYQQTIEALRAEFNQSVGLQTQIAVLNVMEIIEKVQEYVDAAPLDDIRPYAGHARFDPTNTCLAGTRMSVIDKITNWIDSDEDQRRVFLLTGAAGSGKTAIANTIADHFWKLGRLGSSFFFDRKIEAGRSWSNELFSTIARNLADRNGQFKRALLDVIRNDKSLRHSSSPATQFNKLILEPAKKVRLLEPMVIVIDAVDEGGDIQNKDRQMVLELLSTKAHKLPDKFRILVTSRLEPDIQDRFLKNQQYTRIETLDAVPHSSTKADIVAFIRKKLGHHGLADDQYARLEEKAEGLFEWAAVACRFIDDASHQGDDPLERYERLMDICPDGDQEGPIEDHYNGIYGTIICQVTNIDRFKSVMSQILTMYEALPAPALRDLRTWGFPDQRAQVNEVALVLKPLGAVLSGVADNNSTVRPFHASFVDYLMDPARSGKYHISKPCHTELLLASMRIMNNLQCGLHFNICNLMTSYLQNSTQPGLAESIPKFISAALRYACRYGTRHLRRASLNAEILEGLRVFILEKLLFWLEAMSILSLVEEAPMALGSIVQSTENIDVELSKLAEEAQDFVCKTAEAITLSAPHVYISALPVLLEEHRELYSRLKGQFKHIPRILSSAHLRNTGDPLGHTDGVLSVGFSADGALIVSGSDDNIVRVWDTVSGRQIGESLKGHTSGVSSATFSADGTLVVSGSMDKTICIWDIASGRQVGGPLQGHTGEVWSVVFSADGTRVISGSLDNTIRIWDVASGLQIGDPLEGHTDRVFSVAFSADNTLIVSASRDETVRIWDVASRTQIGKPLEGHIGGALSAAFSADGTRIVSGSEDGIVRIWSTESMEQVVEPFEGHTDRIMGVAFSVDGTRVVSGSWDKTVRMWDTTSGRQVGEPFKGHTDEVWSVAISSDGTRIVSGSQDRSIRIWSSTPQSLPPVLYSCDPKHALSEESLDLQYQHIGIQTNGWLRGPNEELLFHVPLYYLESLWTRGLVGVIGGPLTELDLGDFVHGPQWTSCYQAQL